jgi:hypothetical protein
MTVSVNMAARAPQGNYTIVRSGQELQQRLQEDQPSVKYLQLSAEQQLIRIPEAGLDPAAFTSSVVLCNGHTIDMVNMKPYAVKPQSELHLHSCHIFGPPHDSPWAAKTVLTDCSIVQQCEVCSCWCACAGGLCEVARAYPDPTCTGCTNTVPAAVWHWPMGAVSSLRNYCTVMHHSCKLCCWSLLHMAGQSACKASLHTASTVMSLLC